MLQVAENPTGRQGSVNLGIEGLLALVGAVMYGKARNNRVEPAHVGQRLFQVVLEDLHLRVPMKPLTRFGQHGGRKINGNPFRVTSVNPKQTQEATVAGTQVEYSVNVFGNDFQQDGFGFPAMGNLIGAGQVRQGMLNRSPFVAKGCCIHFRSFGSQPDIRFPAPYPDCPPKATFRLSLAFCFTFVPGFPFSELLRLPNRWQRGETSLGYRYLLALHDPAEDREPEHLLPAMRVADAPVHGLTDEIRAE